MPFGQTSNRWIARHLAYSICIDGQQQSLASDSCRRQSGLDPCVPSTNDYDIVILWVNEHIEQLYGPVHGVDSRFTRNFPNSVIRIRPDARISRTQFQSLLWLYWL